MKINIITKELAEFYKKNKTQLTVKNYITTGPQLNSVPVNQNKETHIQIYDIGKQAEIKNIKIYNINNHINKTGENILIDTQKNQSIFYDITKIYNSSKEGKIAECYGNHSLPHKAQPKNKIPCYFLCHYTIMAYIKGYKKISAYILG